MKLHLGCHTDIREGWLNIDVIDINHPEYLKHDLVNPLPGNIQNVTNIYHCHMQEHLLHKDYVDLAKRLRERMVDGGKLVAGVPDFRKLVTAYLNNDWDFFSHCRDWAKDGQMMYILNDSMYQHDDKAENCHRCMYDVDFAIYTHKLAGFSDVKEVHHRQEFGDFARVPYTFWIEATK